MHGRKCEGCLGVRPGWSFVTAGESALRVLTAAVFALFVAAAAVTPASASDLYGVDFTNGGDRLYSVNQATGAHTPIGFTGSSSDGDLASTNTILYGTDLNFPATLFTYNPFTGAINSSLPILGS